METFVCKLCGTHSVKGNFGYCERCELTIFQIDTILNQYLYNEINPEWLIDGMIEIASWAYNGNPRTAAYFNTANEIVFIFAVEKEDSIPIDELTEINFTTLPNNKVIELLEDALILKKEGSTLYPGPISTKLMEIRWDGYEMNSPQIKKALQETHAIISISLTKSLIKNHEIKPKRALTLLHLISDIILKNDVSSKIVPKIQDMDLEFAMSGLSTHTKSKLKWDLVGFNDGEIKIISDIDYDGNMPLKPVTLNYAENIRERFRARVREERMYS